MQLPTPVNGMTIVVTMLTFETIFRITCAKLGLRQMQKCSQLRRYVSLCLFLEEYGG